VLNHPGLFLKPSHESITWVGKEQVFCDSAKGEWKDLSSDQLKGASGEYFEALEQIWGDFVRQIVDERNILPKVKREAQAVADYLLDLYSLNQPIAATGT